jgi:hypothetical protein
VVLDTEDGDLHREELNGAVDGELARDLHREKLPSREPLLYREKKAIESTTAWGRPGGAGVVRRWRWMRRCDDVVDLLHVVAPEERK